MSTASPAARCRDSICLEAFESASIDAGQFDQEAHVYIAWSYLKQYALPEAIARFCAALRRFTGKFGIESKYHETITWFFLILIAERLASSASGDWQAFRQNNADLFTTGPSLIRRYYSDQRLRASLARTQFVLPDRLPLP